MERKKKMKIIQVAKKQVKKIKKLEDINKDAIKLDVKTMNNHLPLNINIINTYFLCFIFEKNI